MIKGKSMPEDTKRKISEAQKGEKCRNFGKKFSIETRMKMSEAKRGSKSHFWRGGVYTKNESDRLCLEARLWREAIYERDGYKCTECSTKKGPFNAHHIKSFSQFPELRFAIDNGKMLCVACHKKTHSYGRKNI